jgi:hypothetical protein
MSFDDAPPLVLVGLAGVAVGVSAAPKSAVPADNGVLNCSRAPTLASVACSPRRHSLQALSWLQHIL